MGAALLAVSLAMRKELVAVALDRGGLAAGTAPRPAGPLAAAFTEGL
jgi:hypothetical protein